VGKTVIMIATGALNYVGGKATVKCNAPQPSR
jgi:hypothetical protein